MKPPCVYHRISFAILLLLSPLLSLAAQNMDVQLEEVYARDEFRWGVKSYNSGLYNKAIVSFEKSLSYKPDDPLTKEWLGKAYYRSGFEEAALQLWDSVIKAKQGTALLQNRVEVIESRRGLGREMAEKLHYVISLELSGDQEEYTLFSRPTSIRTAGDGGFYLVAYGSNEVLLFNANGGLKKRLRGGFQVFDHPFDVIDSGEGFLFVSEFEGNRVSICNYDGYITGSIGEKGRSDGQFLGPQYMAVDEKGYLYVTDWGNRRVCKFDFEGNFILSFGKRFGGYEGLLAPSGIYVHGDFVYVADNMRKHIAVFDVSGNFIAVLGEGLLNKPEGLSMLDDGKLLIADTDSLVSLDLETESVALVSDFESRAGRVLKAVPDINGNLVAVDFDQNVVTFLSEISSIYSGLFVQVESVYSGNFPEVLLAAKVQDRLGNPISGLDSSNFLITEGHGGILNYRFEYSTDRSGFADVSILLDRSPAMREGKEQLRQVILQLTDAIKGEGGLRIISAGEAPLKIADTGDTRNNYLKASLADTDLSSQWKFDMGLRLASSELLGSKNKRAVIFVTAGKQPMAGFTQYDLVELTRYMSNNAIGFYCIYIGSDRATVDEYEYLCSETGGKSFHFYEPEGIGAVVEDILASRNGIYVFKYTSTRNSDFGREYIPVEVEAFLFKRSGRDESGYFAPLEF